MGEEIIYIPGRMKSAAVNGHVTGAVDILDDVLGETQDVINADTYRKDETYNKTEVDNKDQALQVDIDDVESDLRALEVVVQSEQMTIGATEFDTYPQLNSNNPVTSDGIFRKNIEAEIVVGDPVGDWHPHTAEVAYEHVQEEILILNAELQSAQLEIGAVQTDLVPTSASTNMLPSGAIFNTCAVVGDLVGTVD